MLTGIVPSISHLVNNSTKPATLDPSSLRTSNSPVTYLRIDRTNLARPAAKMTASGGEPNRSINSPELKKVRRFNTCVKEERVAARCQSRRQDAKPKTARTFEPANTVTQCAPPFTHGPSALQRIHLYLTTDRFHRDSLRHGMIWYSPTCVIVLAPIVEAGETGLQMMLTCVIRHTHQDHRQCTCHPLRRHTHASAHVYLPAFGWVVGSRQRHCVGQQHPRACHRSAVRGRQSPCPRDLDMNTRRLPWYGRRSAGAWATPLTQRPRAPPEITCSRQGDDNAHSRWL